MIIERDTYLHELAGWPDPGLLAKLEKSARVGEGEIALRVAVLLALVLTWVIAGFFWSGTADGRTGVLESLALTLLAAALAVGYGIAFLRDRASRRRYLGLIAEPSAFSLGGGTVVGIAMTTSNRLGSDETVRKVRWQPDGGRTARIARICIPLHDPGLWVGQRVLSAVAHDGSGREPLLLCRSTGLISSEVTGGGPEAPRDR